MSFREMRRKDRQVFDEDISSILNKGEYGVISTHGEMGYPYGVPVNYVYIDNCIFFHCAKTGQKLDNIKTNEKVSFCVVSDTELMPEIFSTKFKSVIAFGKASEISGVLKKRALIGLIKKYSAGYLDKGSAYVEKEGISTKIIKIDIEHMTGKARL